MLAFYSFSTYLMNSLSYVGQIVRSESILSINCATIQVGNSKQGDLSTTARANHGGLGSD